MPCFNNIMAGAAAQVSADLGDEITQSLRFNGTAHLTRAQSSSGDGLLSNNRTFTFSTWFKIGKMGETNIFGIHHSGTAENWLLAYTSDSFFDRHNPGTPTAYRAYDSSNKYRDPSAWYHLFLTCDDDVLSLRVNNVLQDTTQTQASGMDRDFWIGSENGGASEMTGYLADTYFFQGSVLDAEDNHFIRQNADGIWVPDTPTRTDGTALTADDYGTNGWHLTYDSAGKAGQTGDGAGIGADHSPNNNHCTANGFDSGDVAVYTGNEAGSTSTYESNSSSRTASLTNEGSTFDGDTAGGTQVGGSSGGGYWYLENKSFSSLTGLRLLWGDPSQCADIRLNGTSVGFTTSGNYTVVDTDDIPATVTEIAARRDRDNTQVLQVEVNTGSGFVALLDNISNDVDYFDTPTSNYSTFNPLFVAQNTSDNSLRPNALKDAHLTNGNSTSSVAGLTIYKKPPGVDIYFEMDVGFASTANNPTWNNWWNLILLHDGPLDRYTWSGTTAPTEAVGGGFALDFSANLFANNVDESQRMSNTSFANSIAGIKITDTTITVTRDGNSTNLTNTSFANDFDNGMYIVFQNPSTGTNEDQKLNFGQMPFIHEPAGVKKLQTNNLPEPTIKNGKDYFDVRTYTSASTAADVSIDDLEFKPDLVWIKSTSHGSGHELYDSVRGVNIGLGTNDDGAEGTVNDSMKSFDTNGFTVGTGQSNINFDSRSYVAWCWKADDAWASTDADVTAGTIASSGRRNKKAGFSIISFTGNEDASQSVGHGLDKAPEFVITKKRDNAGNWNTYHASAGSTSYVVLNTTAAKDTDSNMYNGTSDSVVNIGSYNAINADGENMIMYAWHSVDGYSKFGSYETNVNDNGPFVYLGFKPALVILKNVDETTSVSWKMVDSTRSPQNSATGIRLTAQSADNATSHSNEAIDLLSNGFKIRGTSNSQNAPNVAKTVVYAAWAEYPFGGENAPPAPAN